MRVVMLRLSFIVIFLNIIFIPQYQKIRSEGNNFFKIFLNNEYVGSVGKQTDVDQLLVEARREVASASDAFVFLEASVTTEGSEVMFGETDSEDSVRQNMVNCLEKSMHEGLKPAYTVKIGGFTVNLASLDDVKRVLQAAVDKYDLDHEYTVSLEKDHVRELNALTASIVPVEESGEEDTTGALTGAGFERLCSESVLEGDSIQEAKSFSDFDYGLLSLSFDNSIEIVDAYLSEGQLESVDAAIDSITASQDKNVVYEVQSGDTLSGISMATDIPMEKIIALNDAIEDENSMIRVGQEIIITNPEPPLSINRVEQEYIEEDYDAEVVYIDNDEWYTTDRVTRQEPSAGHRNIVAQINYFNDKEVSREVIKEQVLLEAVPKIVERGTKVPPTYIKPISGGRLSSTFGKRNAPTRGASTYHQGVDWAIAKGSSVVASSGGKVTKAGWAKGYGYVVYIQHPDGKETRYGHLSKVLVSVGQTVRQGDKIALSGNSGVSTGPHLHFEIRVNGTAVNPLKYLN